MQNEIELDAREIADLDELEIEEIDGGIWCENCDRLDHGVSQDEAHAHELATGHEVVIHIV